MKIICFALLLLVGCSIEAEEYVQVELSEWNELISIYNDTTARCQMCNISYTANGYYSHKDFYCVWTKDRLPKSINRTEVHEIAHKLIADNPDHFCKYVCEAK